MYSLPLLAEDHGNGSRGKWIRTFCLLIAKGTDTTPLVYREDSPQVEGIARYKELKLRRAGGTFTWEPWRTTLSRLDLDG